MFGAEIYIVQNDIPMSQQGFYVPTRFLCPNKVSVSQQSFCVPTRFLCLNKVSVSQQGFYVPTRFLSACLADCEPGWFGENCTNVCPHLCKDKICKEETGECVSCTGQSIGPTCEGSLVLQLASSSCVFYYNGSIECTVTKYSMEVDYKLRNTYAVN